jgi:hypothetical protein
VRADRREAAVINRMTLATQTGRQPPRERHSMSEDTTTWPELAIALYDKLTGRAAEITYEFDHLDVYVPSKVEDNPKTAKWTLDGTLKIRTRDSGSA